MVEFYRFNASAPFYTYPGTMPLKLNQKVYVKGFMEQQEIYFVNEIYWEIEAEKEVAMKVILGNSWV